MQQPCGMEGIGACGITQLHTAEVTMGPGWGPGAYKPEPAASPRAAPRARLGRGGCEFNISYLGRVLMRQKPFLQWETYAGMLIPFSLLPPL